MPIEVSHFTSNSSKSIHYFKIFEMGHLSHSKKMVSIWPKFIVKKKIMELVHKMEEKIHFPLDRNAL